MVAKVNPSGTGLVYAGYIGGRLSDRGLGIAVDKAGNAFVTGETLWLDLPWATPSFPAKLGPALTPNVGTDVFITKITAAGTRIVYSGFAGGLGEDIAWGIAVDSAGGAYVTGTAYLSTWFPLIGGPGLIFNGFTEGFVTKISAFPGNAGPMLAFRNGFNAIEINTFPSPELRNSGGNFRLDPALAMPARPPGLPFAILGTRIRFAPTLPARALAPGHGSRVFWRPRPSWPVVPTAMSM